VSIVLQAIQGRCELSESIMWKATTVAPPRPTRRRSSSVYRNEPQVSDKFISQSLALVKAADPHQRKKNPA
jgi:hypothetical protein